MFGRHHGHGPRNHDESCRERHAHGGHGRHGPGRFEGGFASRDGFRAGRKLSSIDLQLLILALLARQPAHGYELIRTIEEISGGFYVPSPGMIYPALTYLDEIGHAVAEADGNKKLFSITDAGRAALEADRAAADRIIEGLGRIGAKMDAVRDVFEGRGRARIRKPMAIMRWRLPARRSRHRCFASAAVPPRRRHGLRISSAGPSTRSIAVSAAQGKGFFMTERHAVARPPRVAPPSSHREDGGAPHPADGPHHADWRRPRGFRQRRL
ncbi:PadR family transcriptional regulator [Rhizobium sp. RCAM05350]|nr:PadR family transcriptional regulator [Rhizobium sp. RCAM05350]